MLDQAEQFIGLLHAARDNIVRSGSWGGDQSDLVTLASKNRLYLPLLEAGVFSADSSEEIARRKRSLHVQNSVVISLLATVSQALVGLEFVVFKGPVQQKLLYGTFFHKPAGDVDILVRSSSFDEARRRLESIGLKLPHECSRLWWRYLLGEQHFVHNLKDRPSVDLHHRIQRPGCPSPRRLEWFLEDPMYVDVGGEKVPTLSKQRVALVISLNLVKALYDGESAGSHAFDLARSLALMTSEERICLHEIAKEQGLERTLSISSEIALYMFFSQEPTHSHQKNYVKRLAKSLLDPDRHTCPWKRGVEFLRAFSDDNGSFAKELAWYYACQIGRTLE